MAYYSINSVNYHSTHTVKHSVNRLDPLALDCVTHYTEQKPQRAETPLSRLTG
jgi:hypothetical protein